MNLFDLIFENEKDDIIDDFAKGVARKSVRVENEKANEIKKDSINDFLDKNPKAPYSAIADYVIDRSTPETGKKYLDELNKITKNFSRNEDDKKENDDSTKIDSFDGIQEIIEKKKRDFEKLPEKDQQRLGAPSAFTDNEVVKYANISNKFFIELMYIFYKNCLLQRLSTLRRKTESDEQESDLVVKYHQAENQKELVNNKYEDWKKSVDYENTIAEFEETKNYLTPEKRENKRKKIEELKNTAKRYLSRISELNRESDTIKNQIADLKDSGDVGFKRTRRPADYEYILNSLAAGEDIDSVSTRGRVGYTKTGILEQRIKFIKEVFEYFKKTVAQIKKLRAEEANAPIKENAKSGQRSQEDIAQEIERIKQARQKKLKKAEQAAAQTIKRINQFLKPTPRYEVEGKALGEMIKIIDDNYDKLMKAYARRETGDDKETLDKEQIVFRPMLRTVGRDNEDNFFKSGAKISGKDLSGIKQDFFTRERNVAQIAANLLNKLFAKGFRTVDYDNNPKSALTIAKENKQQPSSKDVENREWEKAKSGAKSINPDVIKDLNEILDNTERNIQDLVGRIKSLNSEDGLVNTLKRLQKEEVIKRNFISPKFQKMDDLRKEIKELEKNIAGGLTKEKNEEKKRLVRVHNEANDMIKYIRFIFQNEAAKELGLKTVEEFTNYGVEEIHKMRKEIDQETKELEQIPKDKNNQEKYNKRVEEINLHKRQLNNFLKQVEDKKNEFAKQTKEKEAEIERITKEKIKNNQRTKELIKIKEEARNKYDNIDTFYNKLLENITKKLEEKNKEFLSVANLSDSYGRVDLNNAVFMTDFFKFLKGEETPEEKKEDPIKIPNVPVFSNKADKKLAKSLEEIKRNREFNKEFNRNIESAQKEARDADFEERMNRNKSTRPRAVLIKKPKEEKKEE